MLEEIFTSSWFLAFLAMVSSAKRTLNRESLFPRNLMSFFRTFNSCIFILLNEVRTNYCQVSFISENVLPPAISPGRLYARNLKFGMEVSLHKRSTKIMLIKHWLPWLLDDDITNFEIA